MAVGEAIASVASPILSIFGQKMANDANLKIARLTNATNKQINDSQLRYQYNQWLRETAYNDPAMQRSRLQAAGFSPFSLVNNGNASPMQFSSPIPAQKASDMQNIFANSGISDIVPSIYDVISKKEDIEGKRYQNHILGISAADAEDRLIREKERHAAELENISHKTKNEQASYDKLIDEIAFLRQSHEYTLQQQNQDLENSRSNGNFIQSKIEEQQIRNQMLPLQLISEIKKLNAEAASSMIIANAQRLQSASAARLNDAQTKQVTQAVSHTMQLFPFVRGQYKANLSGMLSDNRFKKVQIELAKLNQQQQIEYIRSLALETALKSEMSSGVFNKLFRFLGLDVNNVISGLGGAAAMLGIAKGLKGSSVKASASEAEKWKHASEMYKKLYESASQGEEFFMNFIQSRYK